VLSDGLNRVANGADINGPDNLNNLVGIPSTPKKVKITPWLLRTHLSLIEISQILAGDVTQVD